MRFPPTPDPVDKGRAKTIQRIEVCMRDDRRSRSAAGRGHVSATGPATSYERTMSVSAGWCRA